MLIKEKFIVQLPLDKVLKENGDMMAHFRDHPEEHWDHLIKEFEGSRIKFKNWCHKSYLGPRGPRGANQRKYDRAMAYFDSKTNENLNEAFQYEDILSMKFKDFVNYNNGNIMQTLRDLNSLMSRIQGSNEDKERKAYFKAKKFYEKLVKYDQKENDKLNK